MFDFLDSYPWLLPIIIFFGRILDVSFGTLRIIFVSKGEKYKAPIIGFFEVLIWIVVISEIFSRANSMLSYISYAAGYATGNFVGILIEQRIAFGFLLVRIFTSKGGAGMVTILNNRGYGATSIAGQGAKVQIDVVETVIERKAMKSVESIINDYDSEAFFVVEDVRSKRKGIFPKSESVLRRWRQGK
ncbi:MAG: DUF5698 domain-containing protein [Eubacteriales bacterium]|nr:DUF5698 domain-containing protein [Eubacteriales bacterium]